MAISPLKTTTIKGMLVQGCTIPHINRETRVNREAIYKIQKDMVTDAMDNDIHDVIKADPGVLANIAQDVRRQAPKELQSSINQTVKGITSLQKLEGNFHQTFDNILLKANGMLSNPELSLQEWTLITTTLSSSFTDIFNSAGTTVNVAQVGADGTSLSMFQSRMVK